MENVEEFFTVIEKEGDIVNKYSYDYFYFEVIEFENNIICNVFHSLTNKKIKTYTNSLLIV